MSKAQLLRQREAFVEWAVHAEGVLKMPWMVAAADVENAKVLMAYSVGHIEFIEKQIGLVS